MFDKPILIYSEYCKFSKNFLTTLMKHQTLFDSFIRMNIDADPATRKRPNAFYQIQQVLGTRITKVPTLITPNAKNIFSDAEAFKWLEHQIRLLSDSTDEFKPYNPNEMGRFSDTYADVGSTNLCNAKEQSFKFFEKGVIPDDNYLQTSKSWDPANVHKTSGFMNDSESPLKDTDFKIKQSERQYFEEARQKRNPSVASQNMKEHYVQQQPFDDSDLSSKYNTYANQRQTPQQNRQQRNIDFTDPNFGLAGQMNQTNTKQTSQKDKEMTAKLEQLMNNRNEMDAIIKDGPRNF